MLIRGKVAWGIVFNCVKLLIAMMAYHMSVLVQILGGLFLNQNPDNAPGKAADASSSIEPLLP